MAADAAGAVLDAIRARADAATDGPWLALVDVTAEGDIVWVRAKADDDHVDVTTVTAPEFAHAGDYMADADFIAHAREDVPRLLAAVDAVLGLCDRYEHADERYNPPTGQQVAAKVHNAITEALTRKEEA